MLMGFSYFGRLVTCVMLTVALSNAQHLPIQNSESAASVYVHCSVEHIEGQLVSLEDRLDHVQGIVSSLNNPLIKENCTVDLASYGFDDMTKHGYIRTSGGSSEEVYVAEGYGQQNDRNRGVTLVELDANTCTTRNRQHFDTHEYANDRAQLLETLESATAGTIIVGVTADSTQYDGGLQGIAASFFNRYNMALVGVSGLHWRDKFAFIMQKGYPKKSIFQKKSRHGGSVLMKIELRGSTVADVTFNQLMTNVNNTDAIPLSRQNYTMVLPQK